MEIQQMSLSGKELEDLAKLKFTEIVLLNTTEVGSPSYTEERCGECTDDALNFISNVHPGKIFSKKKLQQYSNKTSQSFSKSNMRKIDFQIGKTYIFLNF